MTVLRRAPGRLGLIALCAMLHACSGNSSTPTTPAAPTIAQFAGVWSATSTLTTVSGGECVGTLYSTLIGTRSTFTAAVTQSGTSLSATVTAVSSGLACTYTGTAGSQTAILNMQTCQSGGLIGIRCANGALRDTRLLAEAINLTSSGANAAFGTAADTYNIFVSGTGTGVGVLTINSGVTLSK